MILEKKYRWISCSPTQDTVIAVITAIIMICGGYYLMVHLPDGFIKQSYSFFYTILLVVFPLWWFFRSDLNILEETGIKKQGLLLSAVISILLAIFFLYFVFMRYGSYGDALIPHFLANGLILWEPFFLFAWLQMRFDKAFGIIPGILLTGFVLGAYHFGTYPIDMILVLMGFGWIFAAIFRITMNLFIMWPLTWSISSAEGTLKGGFLLGWDEALLAGIVLCIQVLVLVYLWNRQRNRNNQGKTI